MGMIFLVCPKCDQMKESCFFHQNSSRTKGKSVYCIDCRAKYNKKWTKDNKDKRIAKIRGNALKKFWPTLTGKQALDEYNKLFELANNKCQICGTNKGQRRLAVDHCHNTGKVRGLLCGLCNTSLGGFSDNKELLQKAIAYLEK